LSKKIDVTITVSIYPKAPYHQYDESFEKVLPAPWLDLTLSNPDMPEFEKKDPMLARYGPAEIGKLYAGETDPNHYMLSPINGAIKGLGKITLFIGTHDILCPDARRFRNLAEQQNVPINYFEYHIMNHCFPLFPIPEAEEAMAQMIAILVANWS
jgi:acetyl esterase/lipase